MPHDRREAHADQRVQGQQREGGGDQPADRPQQPGQPEARIRLPQPLFVELRLLGGGRQQRDIAPQLRGFAEVRGRGGEGRRGPPPPPPPPPPGGVFVVLNRGGAAGVPTKR
ncbi:hypothetical protein, partial [Nocardia brasiliensis]|uniref:hypothetical protein n=1 Tax=Nocardia brasiliensis TaxID=37326 RepID=UPI002456627D